MEDLSSYIDDYLTFLRRRNASPLTIRNYSHYLKRLLNFKNSHFPTLSFDSLNIEFISRYKLFLSDFLDEKGMPLDKRTQSYHLIALRSFLKYLRTKRFDTPIHPDDIDIPKTQAKELKFLDGSQINGLLRMAENLRDRSILELLISTGLRVSDFVRLNKEDVDFSYKEINLSKGENKARKVFLSESSIYWLKKYFSQRNDTEKALFIRTAGRKGGSLRLTPRSIQRIVEKYVKKAGLQIKATPHSLRHTFAINLLSEGKPLSALKQMLGHKNISTTQIYTHVTNPQLREIHRKFHRR